jgi:succinate dehydrogenase / fumarate reductase iron-sulfur subunit
MPPTTVEFRIWRQDGPDAPARWDEFVIPWVPALNVISALMKIRENPTTRDGRKVAPPVYDASCLEEVCGSCTMNINGQARQACSTLVDKLEQPIELMPMRKFPLVRDLAVDRHRMFEGLIQTKAWIPIDGSHDLGPGPRQDPNEQQWRYVLSTCMTCGCCLEACPNYGPQSDFVGPQVISQVRLMNTHPTGKMHADARLEAIMGEGGVTDCGNAQNCVAACPKKIPLTTSLAEMFRATTVKAIKDLFRR